MKSFFLSHAAEDKSLVLSIADAIGKDRCWVDEATIDAGDELLDKIDDAISSSNTRVFVLFWSSHSVRSPWVKEESSQARIRKLLRNDIRIIPVILDTTPKPLWLEKLLWVDGNRSPTEIAAEINTRAQKPSLEFTTFAPPAESSFQNRSSEADQIESVYRDHAKSVAVVSGPPGIGKRALCRSVFQNRLPHLRLVCVNLEGSNTPAMFYSLVASRFGFRIPETVANAGDWTGYWSDTLLPTLDRSHDTILLENVHQVLDSAGRLPTWLLQLTADCSSDPQPAQLSLVLTTSRALVLDTTIERRSQEIYLGRITDQDMIRTLRVLLSRSHPRREASEIQLTAASQNLHGYPLAGYLWAAHATRVGVELALLDPSPLQERISEFVGDIISKSNLTPEEQHALLLLALLRLTVTVETLTRDLGVSPKTLTRLRSSMLISPGESGLSVHGLIGKYLIENRTSHTDVRAAHEELGLFFKDRWQRAAQDDPISISLGSQAYFHLLSAGRTSDATIIHWCLKEEASNALQQLYRMRRDEEVITVSEQLIQSLGDEVGQQVLFYYALSLSRRGVDDDLEQSEKIFVELLKTNPDDRYFLSAYGEVLVRADRIEDAKTLFRKARAVARANDPVPSSRLGELLLREGNLKEAQSFIKEAYDRAPNDLRVIASYAHLLEEEGELEKALSLVREGLKRRKDDLILNYRAGRILRKIGNNEQALEHLRIAADGTATSAPYTSLADLYLEMGSIEEAKGVMEKYRGRKDGPYHNVIGQIALKELDFSRAEMEFRKCKQKSGADLVYCGSFATLRMAQAEKALEMLAFEGAKAYVVEAEFNINAGLRLDPDNEKLLSLRAKVGELKKRFLRPSHT